MPYLTLNEMQENPVQLYYEDYGKGKPVVLIHGWPLCSQMWEYQVKELVEAGFRVIAYDRRGFGRSSRPWSGYDYDTLANDLHTLLSRLGLSNATLVGFSMGGGEVVRYLSKYGRSRVEKAVFVSAVTPLLVKREDHPGGVEEQVLEDMLRNLEHDRSAFLETFGRQFFGMGLLSHPVSQALLDHYRQLALQASPRATAECIRSFGYTDFRKEISRLDLPLLIIHGTADRVVPDAATSAVVAAGTPNNVYIRYEGAPHGLFYTHREQLNADLTAFIESGRAFTDEDGTSRVGGI